MAEVKYELKEHLATLSTSSKGWTKEINLVSWNEGVPKYDIREWSPDHSKMSKGITFNADEIDELYTALGAILPSEDE